MRQRWCIALRLPVQLRANNQKAKSYEKSIVLTTELGHMNTISYLPNPRYKKYKTDKIYYEAILSWENTLSWFINYLKNI